MSLKAKVLVRTAGRAKPKKGSGTRGLEPRRAFAIDVALDWWLVCMYVAVLCGGWCVCT